MISQASCAEAAPWDEKAMYMQGFGFEFDKCKVKKEKELEKYKKFPTRARDLRPRDSGGFGFIRFSSQQVADKILKTISLMNESSYIVIGSFISRLVATQLQTFPIKSPKIPFQNFCTSLTNLSMITNYIAKFKTKPNVAFKSHINRI